jgi:hypothetical protein
MNFLTFAIKNESCLGFVSLHQNYDTTVGDLLVPGEPPVVDHESAVLDDFDSRLGENFRCVVVADAGLKPNRLGFLR